ncbi:hypothetical protein A7982_13649 [Minicystis rosea]|nr:hypothetical protein A7982_13649 [Minicystis rosea]
MHFRSFLGFAFPLFLACGSVEVSAPGDARTACHDLFAKRLAFDQRCSGVFAQNLDEDAYVASCAGVLAAPGVTLTVADVAACAKELDTSGCLGGGVFPTCIGLGGDLLYPTHDKTGTLAPGEACFASVQCDSGYCDALSSDCGACQRARTLGDDCGGTNDTCIEGICQDGSCQLPGQKLGADCIDYGEGDCQETLYCKPIEPSSIMGKCTARSELSEACDNDTPCLAPLLCHEGACVKRAPDGAVCAEASLCASGHCEGGACAPLPAGLVVGDDCSVGYCRADLFCDDSHVCRPPPWVSVGGACVLGGALAKACAPDLYCHRTCVQGDCGDGECRPLPEAGEHCTNLGECAASAVCQGFDSSDETKGKCVKLGGLGDACPCVDTLACAEGACAAFGAAVCQ